MDDIGNHQDGVNAVDYHADLGHPAEGGVGEADDNHNNQNKPGNDQVVQAEGSVHVDRDDFVGGLQGHGPSAVAWIGDACWDPWLPLLELEDTRVSFPRPLLFSPLHHQYRVLLHKH